MEELISYFVHGRTTYGASLTSTNAFPDRVHTLSLLTGTARVAPASPVAVRTLQLGDEPSLWEASQQLAGAVTNATARQADHQIRGVRYSLILNMSRARVWPGDPAGA